MKANFPSKPEILEAARRLRNGELVVFPTETVYGLGANALNERAVERIFEAKQRPRTSPLIVHVADAKAARELVTEWPDAAQKLADRFWPGPLTLVLPKQPAVPGIVTSGLGTVGIRVPRHNVALALLEAAGVPVAAPSANLFTRLSPTAREHVVLNGVLVLEGGNSVIGIESTVLSLAGGARLLRPGAVSQAELESVIGQIKVGGAKEGESPGLHAQHYQPETLLIWAGAAFPSGPGAYLWHTEQRAAARTIAMPRNAPEYAACLYRVLHELDTEQLDWVAVEPLPEGQEWVAVRDRLTRAVREPLPTSSPGSV